MKSVNPVRSCATLLLALPFVSNTSFAQDPAILLREGDALGPMGHVVTEFTTVDTNGVGGFAVGVRTSDSIKTLDHIWGNVAGGMGSVLRTEELGLAGFDQQSFESYFGIADDGSLCYSPRGVRLATMETGVDGCWVDGAPILTEGDSPLSEPDAVSRFHSRTSMIDSTSEPVWLSALEDGAGNDLGFRLYRGNEHTPLLETGTMLPGMTAPIASNGIRFSFQVSESGTHYIAVVFSSNFGGDSFYLAMDGQVVTTCIGEAIRINQNVPAESGGLVGDRWLEIHSLGVNEAGDYMFAGEVGAFGENDGALIVNGNIVLRNGDMVVDRDGVSHELVGEVDYATMNEDGDILVAWDIDTEGNEALILNGVVVMSAGDEVDWDNDGVLDPDFTLESFEGSVSSGLGLRSDGMVGVYARVQVMDAVSMELREGLMAVELAPAPRFVVECEPYDSLCLGDGGVSSGCTDCPCDNNSPFGTVGGCLNSAMTSTRLTVSGSSSVSLPPGDSTDLRFSVSGAPPLSTNVLLSGSAAAPQDRMSPCFGLNSGALAADRDGLRCAVQDVRRHGNRTADDQGNVNDVTGGSRVWGGESQPDEGVAVQAGFTAGQTRYFQITHRDDIEAVCMRGLNTSQAVEITFTP